MNGENSNGGRLSVVALVDDIGITGGGERAARQLAVALDPSKFSSTLCVTRWSSERARDPAVASTLRDLELANVRFVGLERGSRWALWRWRPLLSLLRRERIDILHGHKFGSNVWAAILGTVARTPVIVAHEQTWSFEGKPLRRFLDRHLIARRAAAFISVSREDRRRMIELEKIPAERVVLVPNAIPAPARASGRDVREELGIAPGDPVVGTVCVLRPQKALDVLVRAVADLKLRHPHLKAVIAGDGPERAKLERLVAELGLESTVLMLGRRTDVPDVIRAFDVAVLSSDFEGTPLAVMEFMEAGKPIVATRVGGVPDLIDDGVHGRLVERQDPGKLAGAIEELLADDAAAAEMGWQARERRQREFDIDVVAARIGDLYASLYAASRRAGSRSS